MPEQYSVECEDGVQLAICRYEADAPKGVVIIAAALGVKQSFYGRFAQFLAQSGYTAMSFDYRGTGGSRIARESDIQLQEWGTKDLEAVIVHAHESRLPVYVVGHSIGGQLIGLAPSAGSLNGSLLIASSAPYWRRWDGLQRVKMWLAVHLLFPLVTALKPRFPAAAFGLGNQDIPSGCVRTWARWMRRPDYFLDLDFGLSKDSFAAIEHDMVLWGFSDDDLAPEVNIAHLAGFYSNASCKLEIVSPAELGARAIGHTGFFREPFRDDLWRKALAQIDSMGNNSAVHQTD